MTNYGLRSFFDSNYCSLTSTTTDANKTFQSHYLIDGESRVVGRRKGIGKHIRNHDVWIRSNIIWNEKWFVVMEVVKKPQSFCFIPIRSIYNYLPPHPIFFSDRLVPLFISPFQFHRSPTHEFSASPSSNRSLYCTQEIVRGYCPMRLNAQSVCDIWTRSLLLHPPLLRHRLSFRFSLTM